MSEKVTAQLLNKLGLQDQHGLMSKATELLRLLDIKSSNMASTIGDYAKTIICIDLAASSMGIPFENIEDALKISGLRKSAYQNYKRTFEKILDINKSVSINDICVQLGLNEVAQKANALFEIYKNSIDDNVDISHPQYATMCIYQACKLRKVKVSKTKLLPFSRLRQSQWSRLEEQWENNLRNIDKKDLEKIFTIKKQSSNSPNKNSIEIEENDENSIESKKLDEVEEYETWKTRMLTKAFKKYMESKHLDTSNFVLPPIQVIQKKLSPEKINKNSDRITYMDES